VRVGTVPVRSVRLSGGCVYEQRRPGSTAPEGVVLPGHQLS
jgi:hypothetical protein